MPLVLYGIAGSPPCLSVLLTARALGIELEFKVVDMKRGTEQHKSEAFLKMNPAHCVPTLDDNGIYIWESRAIIVYLSEKYGKDDKLYPKDLQLRAAVDTMLYFDNGSLYTSLAGYIYRQVFRGQQSDPDRLELVSDKLATLERILGSRSYAAGNNLTLADLSITCSLIITEVYKTDGIDLTTYPNISSWLTRVRSEMVFYHDVTREGVAQMQSFIGRQMRR